MISEKFEWRVFLRIVLLSAALSAASILIIKGWYVYLFIVIPLIIWQLVNMYRTQMNTIRELKLFVESVRYRDFTRNYDTLHSSGEQSLLRTGFNELNAAFRNISREKETQHLYLKNILELVNTGILSFNTGNGEVVWMNESLKKMLNLPYLKTIHSLRKRDEQLYEEIIALKAGESRIGTVRLRQSSYKILLAATFFQTDGIQYTLIAFQNINEAMDETESKAWQKLLSVLTHEIMNSIAPISSLADTVTNRIQSIEKKEDNSSTLEEAELGITTIKRRSEGLLKFAETYRHLNKITVPDRKKIYVRELFENLFNLMQPTLAEKEIELDIILKDTGLFFEADISLTEQVLINLLLNALDAVKGRSDPQIVLSAFPDNNERMNIRVSDNGPGISTEMMDKIFVPFFSTKKNGSGIGLTLCKQIMMLHHGNIEAQTEEGEGTHFTLTF